MTSSDSADSDLETCREVGFKWTVSGDAAGTGECGYSLPCPQHTTDSANSDRERQRDPYHDTNELRLIGEWLNAAHPIDRDSDGDRVIAAADELDRLRRNLADQPVSSDERTRGA